MRLSSDVSIPSRARIGITLDEGLRELFQELNTKMTPKSGPKKILLPQFLLTEVTSPDDAEAEPVVLSPLANDSNGMTYYVRPVQIAKTNNNRRGLPEMSRQQYNFFPLVLDKAGVPWAEAAIYILSRLQDKVPPSMATYAAIAEDLASYRWFLDEEGLDWTCFPRMKLARPTYRFNSYLKYMVGSENIAPSTARRRMGAVVAFYRWLIEEEVFKPGNRPWVDSDVYIAFADSHGFERKKLVTTTDLSIRVPKQTDPYDGKIADGGKLRPLPVEEQGWLMDALLSLGNTEMTLIHLFGLLTGARIQTILTFRIKHVSQEPKCRQGDVRIAIGLGTGIDTKKNKRMVLHLPMWFYDMLYTYAHSVRAAQRRRRAKGGDSENQYLFLSIRGVPLYQSQEDARNFDATNILRHVKNGQGVRQFITDQILPFIRKKYGVEDYRYRFHDTRATAGMNWTDHQLKLVERGSITLHEAREYVKVRMGHDSSFTTDLYLQYRQALKQVRWAGIEYESHLKQLSLQAMRGVF